MGREMNKMTDGELAYLKRAIKKLEEQK